MTEVVWLTPSYPWKDQPVGGVFYQTQARALARQGVAVTVACPTPWAPWPLRLVRRQWRRYATAPNIAVDEGVTVVRPRYVGVPGEPSWAAPDRFVAGATWRARAMWGGARVVHGHSAVAGLAAWRLSRRIGLPLVLTFHGGDMNVWPDEYPDRISDLRACARAASAVIAVSTALADRIEAITGVAAIVLPIGSDHQWLAAHAMPRDMARELLNLVDERTIVLYVGNLLVSKGVRELVEAIAGAHNRYLGVFVGDGPERGYGINALGGSESIQYRGAKSHAEVVRYMSAADVLVLPSYREGLPTVLVEAGSIGLPVIASPVGGIPELLGNDRGSLLRDVAPASIGQALSDFSDRRSAALAAAARLRAYVLAVHDVDVNAGRLLEQYRLAGLSSGARPGSQPSGVTASR